MVKKKEQTEITILLDKELDTFLEKYAQDRQQTKSELLVQLASNLYNKENDPTARAERLKKSLIEQHKARYEALKRKSSL
ncbi:hypothetical protein JW887_05425 [Candidatus Dojkabacteria bacterium]|nr:hypothetical protein [Candidatus Dojkabacteria bacterium]